MLLWIRFVYHMNVSHDYSLPATEKFLYEFVKAAQLDHSDDRSEFVHSFKCHRDSKECRDEADYDWMGWFIFSILMVSYQLSDFLSGMKLLVLSGKQRHHFPQNIQLFFGGLCLSFVSAFAVFASIVYNIAIARSNPDIVSLECSTFINISFHCVLNQP